MFPFNQYPYINMNDLNLDWIIKHFKEFVEAIGELQTWKNEHEKEYDELKKMVDDLYNGHFSPAFISSLKTWLNVNLVDIVGELIKIVFFAITDEGYFVAFIPDSWSEIIFGTTGLDDFPAGVDYGHLTLSY